SLAGNGQAGVAVEPNRMLGIEHDHVSHDRSEFRRLTGNSNRAATQCQRDQCRDEEYLCRRLGLVVMHGGRVSGRLSAFCPDTGCPEVNEPRSPQLAKAGITSRANQRSCSSNSAGDRPSAQWTMKSSIPGYFSSIDLIPSITCCGEPQNHAFCCTPSRNDGILAGAPGVPQVRPCSSAYRTKPNGANHL